MYTFFFRKNKFEKAVVNKGFAATLKLNLDNRRHDKPIVLILVYP